MPRAQIALEFLLVFSFVLLVFIFIFALIASQRSLGMSYQSFSQLQLVAQSVAMAMSNAANAGNGYSAQMPISSTVGLLPYNLTITKSGMVVASMHVGKQLVQARAYSTAKAVASSPNFAASSTAYLLPIQNGTISIQNSYGEVCIDYNCQSSQPSIVSGINLSSENVYSASFSQNPAGYISAPAPTQTTNSITVSFWIYPVNNGYWGISGNYWENAVSGSGGCWNNYYFFIEAGGNPPTESWSVTNTAGTQFRDFPGVRLQPNRWQQFVGRYNGSYISVWLNGRQIGTPVSTNGVVSYDGVAVSGAKPVTSGGGCNPISGNIANVQVYNSSLSGSQISALYNEGIGGAPIPNAELLDWLPLDGNSNDYGGVASSSTAHGSVIFTATSQLFAKVTNSFGAAVSNVLVGFATNLGTLTSATGSSGGAASNYTNSAGIATAFLNYNGSGTALVKATAFDGNSSAQQHLVAWWPLNLGQGSTAYDLSGKGNNGAMSQTPWSMPNYVTSMNGGYINVANSLSLSPTASMSAFAWINPSSQATAILQKQGSYGMKIGVQGAASGQFAGYVWGTTGVCSNPPFKLNPGTWYFVGFTFNGVMLNEYVNGNLYCNIAYTGSIPTTASPVAFGGPNDNDGNVAGSMANVQIYNTVLSPSQVAQLYQEGISAPPFTSGLAAWWPLNGNANDYSGNGNNGTIYGSVSFETPAAAGTEGYQSSVLAAQFNGVNSIITTPINFNTMSFAVALWVNGASTSKMISGNGYTLFNSIGTNNFQMWLNNGGALGAPLGTGDEEIGFGTNYYHSYGINGSSWNLLAVSVSNGRASLYANGAGPYNVTIPSGPYSLNALAIAQSAAGISPFAGGIANIQLYNQTLSPAQVFQIYQGGISGMPIPGQKMIAWWPLDGNTNDYSGNGYNGTASNVLYNAQQPTKFALLSSLNGYGTKFNGNSGSIKLPPLQALNGHSSFTVNTWLNWQGGSKYFNQNPYPIGWPGCHTGFTFSSPNYLTFYEWYTSNPSNPPGCPTSGGGIAPPSAPLQPNTWYMVTGTYNNVTNIISLYVNGQYYSSVSVPPGNYLSNYDETGYIGDALDGNTGSYFFNGSIANVQIYNTSLSAQQIWQLYQSGMPATASHAIPMSWSP